MKTICHLLSYFTCLIISSSLFILPTKAIAERSIPVIKVPREVSIQTDENKRLTTQGLGHNNVDKMSVYKRFSGVSATFLVSINNVISKNQDLINHDPKTGNYCFKGFLPDVVSSSVANDFSSRTGIKLKQTALRVRNPRNKPDKWEEKALRILEQDGTKEEYVEFTNIGGKPAYRYMKPLYMEMECLMCHSYPAKSCLQRSGHYIEKNYPKDDSFGYHAGELRGGISVIIIPTKADGNIYERFADITSTMLLSIRNIIAKEPGTNKPGSRDRELLFQRCCTSGCWQKCW